ncbi:MAG TPA: hypothetical protein VGP03_09940 [Pseudonocardiaceae bacterium]|nr:hypothetical protein [Pseudonocardiaceae bacterium]
MAAGDRRTRARPPRHGSTLAAGLTLAAEYLPQVVLGPFAGVLADRRDRRRLMLATDLFHAGSGSSGPTGSHEPCW